MKPTPEQKAVIGSRAPVVSLCGPGGTGKTETLALILHSRKDRYPRVLLLAYTNKAVVNMQDRFKGGAAGHERARVSTFHAWAWKLLKNADHEALGYQCPLKLTPGINASTIKNQADAAGISTKGELVFLQKVYTQHLRRGVSLATACKHLKTCPTQRKILNNVHAHCLSTGHIDFDHIPFLLHRACQDPDYAKHLTKVFPCIMVDEFQDLTAVQWKTLKILIDHGTHFVGAGDPYQTLFRFAGASHKRFPELWAMRGCESHMLTKNQRLSRQILNLSNEIRGQIRQHLPGYPILPQSSSTKGEKPIVVVNRKRHMHVRGVIDRIQHHIANGITLKDMVVLVRQDKDASSLVKSLDLEQWPYISHLKNHEPTKSINIIQVVLKIHYGTATKDEWAAVLKALPGVGKTTTTRVLNLVNENRWTTDNISNEGKRVRDVFQKFANLSYAINQAGDDLTTALNAVLDFVRTMDKMPDPYTDPTIENLFRNARATGVLGEILNLDSFGHYVNHGVPDTNDFLTIANIHQYKGGEAKVVFFLAPFPSFYKTHGTFKKQNQVIDEMMVLDTIITRSSRFLYLFFPMGFKSWQNLKPQKSAADFIMPTPPETYNLWTIVNHEEEQS
ncbi:Superfamily I DNA or RNA helicase [Desulfatibacillum alkenivorans DSM 16219]|uniref:DNA 3'-5' helicase n=1 Tax=Desulfatibacillum alkenivorans DSM 16219 TaxID=1121393 RepID=A0A1M6N782_9BACT|nr:ATP-dependent helicase [Desulfatibacillum alkenivorans]SHJ91474.1 Superfamily I DNA or RNA helicase [Desulfatibacillum alkenivorans DSM 16219]